MNVYSQIAEMRKAIRSHRDQRGDDRCWLDDQVVWNTVSSIEQKVHLPAYGEGMRKCRLFYKNRNAASTDPIPADAMLDPAKWDDDLVEMSSERLWNEYITLEKAILKHRNIPEYTRTVDDDRELYSVLPEKIPADFRLPREEEFLGTVRTDAGCPQFWNSHQNCPGEHDLHQWGPCRKS